MSLKQRIFEDHMAAFRSKDQARKAILSVVKGEIQTAEKNGGIGLVDEDVRKILQKISKSLRETIDVSGDEESKSQLEIVNAYLPKQMNREEIEEEISMLRIGAVGPNHLTIGMVMKHFGKLNADKKLVADVFNTIDR